MAAVLTHEVESEPGEAFFADTPRGGVVEIGASAAEALSQTFHDRAADAVRGAAKWPLPRRLHRST